MYIFELQNYKSLSDDNNCRLSCFNAATGEFSNFNYSNGLPTGIFMDKSVLRASDGKLYFGSQNGVCFLILQPMVKSILYLL
jgi:hypothetical protein